MKSCAPRAKGMVRSQSGWRHDNSLRDGGATAADRETAP
jgi:hypothetical protein